jgi:sodium-dependent dicarboxylate transporter 2/3/5
MADYTRGHPEHEIAEPTVAREVLSETEERVEQWRKAVGVFLTPVSFAITYWAVWDSGLSPQGKMLSAILVSIAVLWITEPLPLAVTALLGAVLCVVLGVADARTVLAYYADPIVFLFIGSFMLARAMTIHRLDRRIALGFLSVKWIGARPGRILAGMGLVTAVISMWVSNTATTAMMLPIALGILGALHAVRVARGEVTGPMDARSWPYATGMMLMIAYSASIGGIGTPVGSPPNLIAIGLIRGATGYSINFFQWMALCIPLFALMATALFVLLYALHPAKKPNRGERRPTRPREAARAEPTDAGQPVLSYSTADPAGSAPDMREYLQRERAKLGGWTAGQVNTLVAFAVAVLLWVLPGVLSIPIIEQLPGAAASRDWLNARIPEAVAALIAAILLFVLPTDAARGRFTLSWDEAVKIDWGTILLFGGGLCLGTLMFKTGVAGALGDGLTKYLGGSSVWGLTAIAIALGIVLSEATSNTAASNMVIPVAIAIAQAKGMSPLPPALGACLGASYGFMLPVSTPPNAIVYGSGLVRIPSMIRAGIVFDVLGFFIIWAGLRILCPVLGLM